MLHEVRVPSGERLSAESWFHEGFCVSVKLLSSHGWSSLLDLLFGLALLVFNAWPCSVGQQLAFLVSLFTMMHGLAHGVLGHFGGFDEEFLDRLRPQRAPWPLALAVLLALSLFLAIGPFVGYVHGVSLKLCVAIHLTSMVLFVLFVPLQFAFGAVQLVLYLWICLPRLMLIGPEAPERLKEGWLVISVGILLLMPLVFSEMLFCDLFFKDLGGHAVYDAALLLLAAAYSLRVRKEKGKA